VKLLKGKKNKTSIQGFFLYFYNGVFIIIKLDRGIFSIWLNIKKNINKTKAQWKDQNAHISKKIKIKI
jgi:hypothetical protein